MQKQIPIVTWDHLVVRVSNLERSLEFYREHLSFETEVDVEIDGKGLEKILEAAGSPPLPGAAAHLVMGRVGGQLVELIEYSLPEGMAAPGNGISAFTLRVSDADEAHSVCRANDIACDSDPVEIEGSRQFFIRDPDGIRIELTQPPKADQ